MATISELDATINQLSLEEQSIVRRNSDINALIAVETASYNSWVAANNYDEAHRHSDAVDQLDGERNANNSRLAIIRQLLPLYQEQKQSLINAQNAANAQTNANAALTTAQSNLTPEQLFQLQLEKIKADKEAKAQEAKAKLALAGDEKKLAADKAAQTKRYILWGVVAVVGVVGIVVAIKFLK